MAGYVLNMNILVSNINCCGQKGLSFKVRHKAYARPLCLILKKLLQMRNGILLLAFLMHMTVLAQDDTLSIKELGESKIIIESMPEFVGGLGEWNKYIKTKTIFTKKALDAGAEGKVYVSFWVEKDGTITNPTILKGLHPDLDSISLTIITNMPNWKPALENGEPIRHDYFIPIEFNPTDYQNARLQDQEKYWRKKGKKQFYKKCLKELGKNQSECDCLFEIIIKSDKYVSVEELNLVELFETNECK